MNVFTENKWIPIGLAGSTLFAFILSLTVGNTFCVVLNFLLLSAAIVWTVFGLIQASRNKNVMGIISHCVRIVGCVLLCLGMNGLAMLHSSGISGADFDALMSWGYSMGLTDYAASEMGFFDRFNLMCVSQRTLFLILGIISLIVSFFLGVYSKYGTVIPPALNNLLDRRPQGGQAYAGQFQGGQQDAWEEQPQSRAPRPDMRNLPMNHGFANNRRLGIRPDQCCICGGGLNGGFAPLFTLPNGMEARIDEGCWQAVSDVYTENNPAQISEALNFLSGKMTMVDPAVVPYIQEYLNVGRKRLNDLSQTSSR